jgi:hypothetical protein
MRYLAVNNILKDRNTPGVSEGVCHGVKTDAYAYKRIATVDTVSVATGIVKALNGAGISHLLWPNFTHQSSPWWC